MSALLMLPVAASAGHWVYQSDSTLRWHDNGRYLHLTADKRGGVDVLGVTPAGLWGLAEGDTIVQADGRPVSNVAGLLATLRAHGETPLPLVVRHAGVERSVLLASDARALVAMHQPAAPSATSPGPANAVPGHLVFQSDNSLRWSSEGRRLHLVTSKGKDGVDVVALTPGSLWGLAKGDRILAVRGEPTHNVAELLGRLGASGDAPIPLTVRRGETEQTIQLAAGAHELVAGAAPVSPPSPPPAAQVH